jgi:polyisoprenoid-binding protein YceI
MSTATDRSALTGDYTIDISHSRVGFKARHAMVTNVRGSFNDFAGSIHLDGDKPEASTASVTIKVASIDTRNEQRDGHLRSNDFLSIDEFPEITFTSTGVEEKGDETFAVTGDLTIKGVTKPVTFEVEYTGTAKDPFGNLRVGFEGTTTINRKDWGVSWNAALETGGVLVSDKITLELEISAIKTA